MASIHIKLTKQNIETIKPINDDDVWAWDTEITEYGLRVKPSGVKSFFIQYRPNGVGRSKRHTFGQFGKFTADQARKTAKVLFGQVAKGGDPSLDRKNKKSARTIKELCECYYRDAVAGRVLYRGKPKKASTLSIDIGRINRHIIPLLGQKAMEDVTRHDVESFLHSVMDGKTAVDEKTGKHGRARVTGGPGTAAKSVSLLGAIFKYSIKKGWRLDNPCTGVELPKDNVKQRFLSADELKAFGAALRAAHDQGVNRTALNVIEALALTGCRKGEILALKKRELDATGQCIRLEDSKSGAQLRPCGWSAMNFLTELAPEDANDYIFPASRGDGHFVSIAKPLAKVCALAGLSDVTAHVLRHTFATTANEIQYSELTIAGLLGHSAGSVTARYVHHVDRALADAADRVSAIIASRLEGRQSGDVIALPETITG
jgi:integrase